MRKVTVTSCKGRMTRQDAQPIQNALVFYANPQLSVGGTFAECTVLVVGIRLVPSILLGGTA